MHHASGVHLQKTLISKQYLSHKHLLQGSLEKQFQEFTHINNNLNISD